MSRKRKANIITYGKRGKAQRHFVDLSSDPNLEMFFPDSNDIDTSQKPLPAPPPKPTSQKAASMPTEPEEDKIATLIEITGGMSRVDAIRYLKVCSGRGVW